MAARRTGRHGGRNGGRYGVRIGGPGGFTLLEVLIAVAILAVSLSSLMASQVNSMAATRYARDISAIALLTEYQIIEIEWKSRKEGWVNSDVKIEGDFSDYGYRDVEWKCTIFFTELPEYNDMMEAKEGADEAQGKDGDNVIDQGDKAFAGLGMVWGVVKQTIELAIRKVECTAYWEQGTVKQEYTLQTFWTNPAVLQTLPGAGGEFTDEQDPSGEEGGGKPGSAAGGGASGTAGTMPPGRGGSTAPATGGMMGGK